MDTHFAFIPWFLPALVWLRSKLFKTHFPHPPHVGDSGRIVALLALPLQKKLFFTGLDPHGVCLFTMPDVQPVHELGPCGLIIKQDLASKTIHKKKALLRRA